MTTSKRELRTLRRWLLMAASALFLSPVQAQESDDMESELEEITVTGSRIPRAGFDTLMPAIVVDAQFVEDRGFTDIASALNEIPSFGVPGNSTEGTQGQFSVGQNFVNFFGLGSQRTLTLVNGRRFVSSNSPALSVNANPGLQVDLNVIPASLIDRVETIAVGGAPIYGADAIAGTVNVIMKQDFEGFDINTSYGASAEGDMNETEFGFAWGANSADGRGNVVLAVEYTDREGILENQRSHLNAGWQFRLPLNKATDCPDTVRCLIPDGHANIVSNGGVATPGGTLAPGAGVGGWDDGAGGLSYLQFAPDGSLVPYNVGISTGNAIWSSGGEGIFLPDVTNLYTPLERTLATAFAHYDLTDSVEVFGELWVAKMESEELANQPAYQSGVFGEETESLRFDVTHPLLTPAAVATLQGLPQAPTEFWIQRASVDLRPNNNSNSAGMNMLRVVGGLKGEFFAADRMFNWDVSYNVGQSESDSRARDIDSERFFYALDVVLDGNGQPACRIVADPTTRPVDPATPFNTFLNQARYDSCVPLDIFGEGRPSQDAINYITKHLVAKTEIKQQVISANMATEIIELPAGSLGAAIGVEHREETADFQSGGWAESGLGRFGAINSVLGEYETDEIYAEFFAPIFSSDMNIPFMDSLSIEGAFRTVDNSFAGKDDTWTIGARWAPIPDVEFRGNVTQSVRAPAVTELFLPLSDTFSFAQDPCDARHVDEGPNPATRRANCVSGGGTLPGIPDPDNFASTVENASVSGRTGGNIALQNETADAWTAGFILRPRFVEGLTVAADFVSIDIEQAIESFTLTQIMNSCYDQNAFPNSPFCSAFRRDANGQLPSNEAFQSGYVNAGLREFRGWTIDAAYATDLFAGTLDITGNFYLPQEDTTKVLESVDRSQGEPDQPDLQFQLNARYSQDSWTAMLQSRFIGEAVFDNDDARVADGDPENARDIMGEGSVWIFNGAFMYDFNDTIGVQLNINNIFDEAPSPGVVASGWDNVYNNIGRFYRLSLSVSL